MKKNNSKRIIKNQRLIILILIFISPLQVNAQKQFLSEKIRFLKQYDRDHLYRIAMPLGGIGTGTVSIGGNGALRDWEIMNVPAKDYSTVTTGNDAPFCHLHKEKKRKPQVKAL